MLASSPARLLSRTPCRSIASTAQLRWHSHHVHHEGCSHDHDHQHQHSKLQSPFAGEGATTRTASRKNNNGRKEGQAKIPRPVAAIKYCEDLVRKADYEGFLSTQFFPTKKEKETQMALRAFNIELASIREHVSRSDIGRMRMQFWRDNLEKIFSGHPPQQPTALALAYAIQEEEDPNKQLSTIWLKRMITERERNLTDPQFMTLSEMETYSENTLGSLFYLQLESVGVRSLEADHAASHLGKAMGIATLLRAFRFHMLQNRMIIPAEITAKHGISQEALFRNPTVTEALQDATLEVATAAHIHLATAKSFCKSLPHEALPVMMAGIPTEGFLQRLEKEDFNPLAPSLLQREWFLPAKMWNRWRKGQPFGPYEEA
ncbi:NADH dehydrogenase (ubiquinone) complex I, assembly factor 6 [Actinomortierella wolfii]|nr:NADH dehydrogenase (ubiquinone) complex I, assembly factor 6 [Actinomortierella wolfii]